MQMAEGKAQGTLAKFLGPPVNAADGRP
jgi:hypothetical protein